MATWQEIGMDNFRAARALYEGGYYRGATSRFYYAAFSVLTYELVRRGAAQDFRDNRATPSHAQLARRVEAYFTHMSETEVLNVIETYVNRHQPHDYRLHVSRLGVQHDGDWWYVVVTPEPQDIRARDYRDLMEQVEDELKEEKQMKVLLIPALPGD